MAKRRIAPSSSEEDELQEEEEEEEEEFLSESAQSDEYPDEEDQEPESAAPAGLKLKLKLSNNSQTSTSPDAEAPDTPEAGPSTGRSRRSIKPTAKALETPVPASPLSIRSSKRKRSGIEYDEQGSDGSQEDSEGDSSVNYAKMTARQRAREVGEDPGDQLMSLPMGKSKKKILTEAELALKRSEDNRKRRAQVDKKLEDEKQETVNRLLKKQVGRAKGKKPGASGKVTGTSTPQLAAPASSAAPTMYRYVCSIKSGEFISSYSLPPGSEGKLANACPGKAPAYPSPRPPPLTRRFEGSAVA